MFEAERDSYIAWVCPMYRYPSRYVFWQVDTCWHETSSVAAKESHKALSKVQWMTVACG